MTIEAKPLDRLGSASHISCDGPLSPAMGKSLPTQVFGAAARGVPSGRLKTPAVAKR
jgi:hypothetical protein